MPLGPHIDGFGTDVIGEFFRVLQLRDRGWSYYEFLNPESGLTEPKSRLPCAPRLARGGRRARRGDLPPRHPRHLPRRASQRRVVLAAEPSMERLEEFVRCAALEVESKGYFAMPLLESDPRWRGRIDLPVRDGSDGEPVVFGDVERGAHSGVGDGIPRRCSTVGM